MHTDLWVVFTSGKEEVGKGILPESSMFKEKS